MTIFGELFGYDRYGNDLIGTNENPNQNCAACGMAVMLHSLEQQGLCMKKLYAPMLERAEAKHDPE